MKKKSERKGHSTKTLSNKKGEGINKSRKKPAAEGGRASGFKTKRPKTTTSTTKKKSKTAEPTSAVSSEKAGEKRKLENGSDEGIVKKKLKTKILSKKEKKQAIKMKKDSTGLQSELMGMYEKLRRKDVAADTKSKIIEEVLESTEGKEQNVIFKHDCVRVLEFCVKFGNEKQRERIFNIYKEHNVSLMKSKYAKHLVKKLMKYGTKSQRDMVIKALHGSVKHLLRQKEASGVLEYIYQQFANSSQRASMIEEFYGPNYAIFKAAIGRKLKEIFEKEPDKKPDILRHMKDALIPMVRKESVAMTIVHKPLLEFFTFADGHLRAEMIESLRDQLVHMLHTYEGSRVAMNCIWFGSAKDRKLILKTFKSFVSKISMEEFGHLALQAAFDVIDDTVFATKAIISEITANLDEIVKHQYGRKVILYLLSARDKRYFTPHYIQNLEGGDGNQTSKKDQTVRRLELRKAILNPLLKHLEESVEEVIKDKSLCQILLAALEHSDESTSTGDIMRKIVDLAGESISENDNDEDHIVCHACSHWVIKRLVQQDKARLDKGEENIFSRLLVKSVSDAAIREWVTFNRGAFVVASLLESGIEDVVKSVKESLKSMKKSQLTTGKTKGMDVVVALTR